MVTIHSLYVLHDNAIGAQSKTIQVLSPALSPTAGTENVDFDQHQGRNYQQIIRTLISLE